jgi:hypothetical protein
LLTWVYTLSDVIMDTSMTAYTAVVDSAITSDFVRVRF